MGNLNTIISIQDLLKGRCKDFDSISKNMIKLIRHADKRVGKSNDSYHTKTKKSKDKDDPLLLIDGKPVPQGISNLYELYIYHRDLFDKYQSEQKKGLFDKTKYLVVFLGEKGITGRFLGVYEIVGRKPSNYSINEETLELRHVNEFKFLEEKVIIEWSKNTQTWHQSYNQERQVIRIEEGLAKANGTPVFKSYPEVILDYSQLKMVLNDPDWITVLKAVNCIYLIVDKSNGKTYIGSTSGKERIFQRWSQYGESGHGGNVELEKLIKKDNQYHHKNFQWSILETLNSNITQKEAIERENLWKRKLLSLKHGYNDN